MDLPGNLGAFLAQSRNLILAGSRADGRPHVTPTWFCWDGERFYVSTTRGRVKYKIFRRDPRAQLLLDDPAGLRAVILPATVEIREDVVAELQWFRAIREKYGMEALADSEHLESLAAEGRVPPTARHRPGASGASVSMRPEISGGALRQERAAAAFLTGRSRERRPRMPV